MFEQLGQNHIAVYFCRHLQFHIFRFYIQVQSLRVIGHQMGWHLYRYEDYGYVRLLQRAHFVPFL